MTDGVQGVNYYSGNVQEGSETFLSDETTTSNSQRTSNKGNSGGSKNTSAAENELVSFDFESMSYEEVLSAVKKLETQMLTLSGQLECFKTVIESDEQLKEMFEEQYDEIKRQFEEAQEEFLNCDDPTQQLFLNNKVMNLSNLLNTLSSQVMQALNRLQDDSLKQTAYSNELMQLNASYVEGMSVASDKAAEMARRQARAMAALNASTSANANTSANSAPSSAGNAADGANFFAASSSSNGVSSGHVSQNMLNSLKGWEGLRTTAYKCPAGVWTIGYGHTSGVQAGQQITEAQAEQYLRADLASFENEVTAQAKAAGVNLTQGQFDALVSFAYNCGGGALQKSGIMGMLKSGNTQGAASKLKEYVHGGGKVLPGLVSRRGVEAGWMLA